MIFIFLQTQKKTVASIQIAFGLEIAKQSQCSFNVLAQHLLCYVCIPEVCGDSIYFDAIKSIK